MTATHFTPVNTTERLLAALPKECSCNMCQASKKNAKQELGQKRFQEICKLLKICI